MSDQTTLSWPGSITNLSGAGELLQATRVAFEVKRCWQQGEVPDLAGVLGRHPELEGHRSVVLDLAYEEYRLRVQTGEAVDAEEFSRRFPALQNSLYLLIAVQSMLRGDPDFQARVGIIEWPDAGSPFLGFDLIAEIGRGTFGRVFLAAERALGERQVVLKVAVEGGQEAERSWEDFDMPTSCRFIPCRRTRRRG